MSKLNDKVAIVTGAAMGNGKGIARVVTKYGAQAVLWDIDDKVFETAKAMASGHNKAIVSF